MLSRHIQKKKMIKVEYTLVKWKDGVYREMPVTIQQDAVEDFCEMVGWDEEDFSNNTIRRPIYVDEIGPVIEDLKNSEQKIEPIIIDPKIKEIAKKPKLPKNWKNMVSVTPKRKRRTNAEMIADGEQVKEKRVPDKRTQGKYPKEMKEFIEEHMDTNSNSELCELINKKWDCGMTLIRLNSYMSYKKIKRDHPTKFRDYSQTKKPEKAGPKTKYTEKVVQFLRDNVNNFSNKELCEEVESKYGIKLLPDSMSTRLNLEGIKRDYQIDVDQEVIDFILKSKIQDPYTLRDKIIEKFEKNIQLNKIRTIMKDRVENLPGEKVDDEVKRIKEKREEFADDEDVDDMGLDD